LVNSSGKIFQEDGSKEGDKEWQKDLKVPNHGPAGGSMGMKGQLQQLQKLQEQIELTQAQLAEETVTATVGGGAVKVTVTGDQRLRAVEIAPSLLEETDVEMLQDLILTAVNTALDQSRRQQELGPLPGIAFKRLNVQTDYDIRPVQNLINALARARIGLTASRLTFSCSRRMTRRAAASLAAQKYTACRGFNITGWGRQCEIAPTLTETRR
jgi:DNA-binding YbaB/EbfC family protein